MQKKSKNKQKEKETEKNEGDLDKHHEQTIDEKYYQKKKGI